MTYDITEFPTIIMSPSFHVIVSDKIWIAVNVKIIFKLIWKIQASHDCKVYLNADKLYWWLSARLQYSHD